MHVQSDPPGFDRWSDLHTLLNNCFAYMEGRIGPPSSLTRMTAEILQQKAKMETLVIVEDGTTLVACAYFNPLPEALYIGKIAVAAPHRRKGITRKIIALAENHAKALNKSFLEIQTRIELVENHQTFERLGFIKTGESSHEGYARATSITMRKRVG